LYQVGGVSLGNPGRDLHISDVKAGGQYKPISLCLQCKFTHLAETNRTNQKKYRTTF